MKFEASRIRYYWIYLIFLLLMACSESVVIEPPMEADMNTGYFPPINSDQWETELPITYGWNQNAIDELNLFHEENGTRAFIVIKGGKIVIEEYWGKDLRNENDFDQTKQWYWASASKTLVALATGIAQEQGYLNINDRSSKYLGEGWTSMSKDKEDLITIKHQLTMTTGLDYIVRDLDCIEPGCLHYGFDVGSTWFYHNAPYTLINDVVSNAVNLDFYDFVKMQIGDKIGMNGFWLQAADNRFYNSTARDAARFGLLLLHQGVWGNDMILNDEDFMTAMLNSSQSLNPSYGYLTWLNGKSSIVLPGSDNSMAFSLAPKAPSDLIAAMGKNGQFIDVVPSEDLVVIRMGEAPENSLVPAVFHNEMWEIISRILR